MKKIEIYADVGHVDTVKGIVEQYEIRDFWPGAENEEGRISMRLLVDDDKRQVVMDALQAALGGSETTRMVISPVEAVLPKPSDDGDSEEKRKKSGTLTREELYNSIEKNAELTNTYLLLVGLSTFVVAIGLLADNVAVVIAAMVIAPLLGPNLALSFSTSLGDTELVWKSLKTLIAGLLLAFIISLVIGYFWQKGFESRELLDRTRVNLASVALALASGYAAVLSMVTGLSTVLVGVMVSVALLPPVATMGLMLGSGQTALALGAGILLAVNIVCLNLAAKLAFLVKGIKPRTWLEQKKAKQSFVVYILFWLILLSILVAAILLHLV